MYWYLTLQTQWGRHTTNKNVTFSLPISYTKDHLSISGMSGIHTAELNGNMMANTLTLTTFYLFCNAIGYWISVGY